MPGYEFLIKPKSELLTIATEQVHNTLYSFMLLEHGLDASGLSLRLEEIYNSMSYELKFRNKLVMNGLFHSVFPDSQYIDFESYLQGLEEVDPLILRDRSLNTYIAINEKRNHTRIEINDIIASSEAYISFLIGAFGEDKIDLEIEKAAFTYMVDPERMKDLIVLHLSEMWNLYFKADWKKNENIVQESVRLYKEAGIQDFTKTDVLEFLGCGSDDCDRDLKLEKINRAKKIYLVPSVHLGPYKGKMYNYLTDELWLFYGSLLPDGSKKSTPELSQTDILTHLNALTDGSRLTILKMCSTGSEFSSTQIMNELEISQSAVSRHLKQLSATGFLHERRENSSKYYSINIEKIKNTISSFAGYLNLDSN